MSPKLQPSTRRALAIALALLPLAGCGGDVARSFGFTRDPPDEFQVTTRAPLSVPPDFALRPPRDGRPQAADPAQGARALVLPVEAQPRASGSPASPGEQAFLRDAATASSAPVPPDIRQLIDRESQSIARADATFTNRVLGFGSERPGASIPVDATAEARRLRENAALGREVTEGDTPIVQPRRKGLFEGLFGG